RLLAAKKLKLKKVPVIRAEHLSEVDKRAFALADNRLPELSGIDEKKLQKELDDLFAQGQNLETMGYSTADLSIRLVSNKDEIPLEDLATSDVAVTRPGDCWVFSPTSSGAKAADFANSHRMLCANSLEVENVEGVMRGQVAGLVLDDAPYNV